jgi:hypothetical protein
MIFVLPAPGKPTVMMWQHTDLNLATERRNIRHFRQTGSAEPDPQLRIFQQRSDTGFPIRPLWNILIHRPSNASITLSGIGASKTGHGPRDTESAFRPLPPGPERCKPGHRTEWPCSSRGQTGACCHNGGQQPIGTRRTPVRLRRPHAGGLTDESCMTSHGLVARNPQILSHSHRRQTPAIEGGNLAPSRPTLPFRLTTRVQPIIAAAPRAGTVRQSRAEHLR